MGHAVCYTLHITELSLAGTRAGQHGHCQTRRFILYAVGAFMQPAVWTFVELVAFVYHMLVRVKVYS